MNEVPAPPLSGNLFTALPLRGAAEAFDVLHESADGSTRIERIVSDGHASPPGFWYEQPQDEWVMVVQGEAQLEFDDGRRHAMRAGDWVMLPARCRHRVATTGPATVWLAVHMGAPSPG